MAPPPMMAMCIFEFSLCAYCARPCCSHGPGQWPPRKGRPAALAASPFPQGEALREKGEVAKPLRGMYFILDVEAHALR